MDPAQESNNMQQWVSQSSASEQSQINGLAMMLALFSFHRMRISQEWEWRVTIRLWHHRNGKHGTWAKHFLIDVERFRRGQTKLGLYHKQFEKLEAAEPYQWLFQQWSTGHEENADAIQRFVGKDCASEQLPIAQIPEMVICADSKHRTASELHTKAAGLPAQAARETMFYAGEKKWWAVLGV